MSVAGWHARVRINKKPPHGVIRLYIERRRRPGCILARRAMQRACVRRLVVDQVYAFDWRILKGFFDRQLRRGSLTLEVEVRRLHRDGRELSGAAGYDPERRWPVDPLCLLLTTSGSTDDVCKWP